MKRFIKLLVLIVFVVVLLLAISRYSTVLADWAAQLWGLDETTLDKINKWTGILADGGTVVAVLGGLIWGFIIWPWKTNPDSPLLSVGSIKTDEVFLDDYRRYITASYESKVSLRLLKTRVV